MVIQKALENVKERPHDEKKAVASGIAIAVVIVLLIGWGFLFLRKIQRGGPASLQTDTVPEDQFNAAFLRDTQQQLNDMYQSAKQLEEIRDNAAASEVNQNYETETVSPNGEADGFGAQDSAF